MNTLTALTMNQPPTIWRRSVKVNFDKLLPAMGKGAIDLVTLNWGAAAKDALDVVGALGLNREPSEIAWLLVHKSLLQAMLDLTKSHQTLFRHQHCFDLTFLCQQLDGALAHSDLVLDANFFQKPERLAIVKSVQPPYQRWLEAYGLHPAEARAMSDRLPSYFVYALTREWAAGKEPYTCLREHLNTPFTPAYQREQAWNNYEAWLQQKVNEPLFEEAFSLQQIYIQLRAYYEGESPDAAGKTPAKTAIAKEKPERIVVDLQTELEAWLHQADERDAIRVISGGPGCGKSSFTKMFAAYCAGLSQVRVLLIPLHQFEPMKDLTEAIGHFIEKDPDGLLPPNPLKKDHAQDRLLLIFDGLDELAMQGKIAAEAAQQFVQEVGRTVDRFNHRETRVQALISGRELVIQANSQQFRRTRQVLHILPYFERQEILATHAYSDAHQLLRQDQRQTWWQRYGDLTGGSYPGLPTPLEQAKLTEITAQPLLNYLVALSFTQGNLDFTQDHTLNTLYADLLKCVHRRDWERYQHPTLGGIDHANFVRILEEIAVACWHGNGRTATVSDIEAYCVNSGLQSLLEIFQEGAKVGVIRLLAAFYFRQSGVQGADKTFEFTHKSFGEYLTAQRIVRELTLIEEEWTRHKKTFDRGWNTPECLRRWAQLCGPTTMDAYLFEFIRDEMQVQDRDKVLRWQHMLCELMRFMLDQGMPMEKLSLTYPEATHQARNAEESLLAVLNACAETTATLSRIDGPTPEAFGTWLSKVQGQRIGEEQVLALRCLSYLDLQDVTLHFRDLYAANLYRSNLRGIGLRGACLIAANLEGTNLEGANLVGARLQAANLRGANLHAADLQEADVREANLEGANLEGANLVGTWRL